ncbi:MAG TPA: hypothetical protein VHV26_06610 [Rhizomicrobium sp.]|jgi:hypothetical protein|nr:hypothetical protein [Rhizomicrobium sp.]
MRAVLILPIFLGLLGCNSIVRKDGDWINPQGHTAEQFESDDRACEAAAAEHLTYDVTLMNATSYDRDRAFNTVYLHCMTSRRYTERPYWKNWLPAN